MQEVYVVTVEFVVSNLYGNDSYCTKVFDSEEKAVNFIQKEIFEIYDYGPDLNMDDYTEDELKNIVNIPSYDKILVEAKSKLGMLRTDAIHNMTIYRLVKTTLN